MHVHVILHITTLHALRHENGLLEGGAVLRRRKGLPYLRMHWGLLLVKTYKSPIIWVYVGAPDFWKLPYVRDVGSANLGPTSQSWGELRKRFGTPSGWEGLY